MATLLIIHPPQIDTMQMSINRQMDKEMVVYPYNRIQLKEKEVVTNTCYNIDESQKVYAKLKSHIQKNTAISGSFGKSKTNLSLYKADQLPEVG